MVLSFAFLHCVLHMCSPSGATAIVSLEKLHSCSAANRVSTNFGQPQTTTMLICTFCAPTFCSRFPMFTKRLPPPFVGRSFVSLVLIFRLSWQHQFRCDCWSNLMLTQFCIQTPISSSSHSSRRMVTSTIE